MTATAARTGKVRAVCVVRPHADRLDSHDVLDARPHPRAFAVIVDLEDCDYTPAAASALADLSRQGHFIDIRGGLNAVRLADEIETLLGLHPDGKQ